MAANVAKRRREPHFRRRPTQAEIARSLKETAALWRPDDPPKQKAGTGEHPEPASQTNTMNPQYALEKKTLL